ncbi:MAG: MotA/TolQ/ExbB proton channel family protein [Gammaproteobacteria bacterium]|nr:MotA/TolQ/ExbB proton channel family protein [Gammaproteobacteria bacterium]NIN62695.1 MotA/TolQ/ExbB proton channel family protein [Gammaproteobacteria bacterium]NIO63233.1 MotA/TolQ/ExbB proton channel family protein [Gammaproteobacteria bacterium]NIQ11271.1 MotA/TolQ/ExbB proton channel family protein [Gammaproteobacteria bacterium]NIQ20333.1 MotA/TolQ/ExbB proton channel family protein [Gammaproteobacteria bacterium]
MQNLLETAIEFFERGGPIFMVVLIVSVGLWILILERYWYVRFIYPKDLQKAVDTWHSRTDHTSWYAMRIREGLLADIEITSSKFMLLIHATTSVLPLLGLLGTVTGMIALFDIMNVFSTGNTQGMATGISRALLPTIAGLVTALAGIYFCNDLEHRISTYQEEAKDCLQI